MQTKVQFVAKITRIIGMIGLVSAPLFSECEFETCCFEDDYVVLDPYSTLYVRYVGGRGLGFDSGYTTIGGRFFINPNSGCVFPFVDLRAHYLNENEWAANGGLGFRYSPECSNRIYGINAFFDYRSDCGRSFHPMQGGIGFELLGCYWDIRINGYLPIKRKKTFERCEFSYPGDFFIFKDREKYALTGFNAEIGHNFFDRCCPFNLYAAIGPYYYGGHVCHQPWGGAFRLAMSYCNYLSFGGGLTHDSIFNTRAYGYLQINIPLGCNPCCENENEMLSQPVWRNELIVTDEFCRWRTNY